MIKLILAEDQGLVRGALSTLLGLEADIEILAEAENGNTALQLVRSMKPDVLVTDIEMPELSGVQLAERIFKEKLNVKVLIVTTFARPGYLQRAMQAGVSGYVLKDSPSEELAKAIRIVAAGGRCIDPDLAADSWGIIDPLTDRERSILRLAEEGRTNKEIAITLNLTAGTVRNYLAEATRKLGVTNRVEAFRIARENGWL